MNKLWVRLSIGYSLVVVAAVLLVALSGILVGWLEHGGRDRGRDRPERPTVALLENLSEYYQSRQTWNGSELLLLQAQSQTMLDRRPDRAVIYFLADDTRHVVYHIEPKMVGRPLDRVRYTDLTPIQVNDQTVGYLGSIPAMFLTGDDPPEFVRILGRSLLIAAAVVGLGGIVFGVVMSRSLTAPLDELARAARDIGARRLNRRVKEEGSDEVIAVSRAFNDMAADLQQAETQRRNLLADVAHELRTPLTVLQGNLRAILDEVYPLSQEEMVRLYEHTRFLSRLVNDLHELAQAEAHQLPLDLQTTALNPLVQIATENFAPAAAEKEVNLQTNLADALPPVHIDSARIQQVLQNLLANALRHTATGDTITVSTAVAEGGVLLTISDTGDGIDPAHLPHVFDRFYRADSARTREKGGAGLGLAIVRAIVEAHHGHISVDSPGLSGRGTTFTITLPNTAL